MSNGSIKHEEEKIIKKLFRNFVTPLLIYKMLKGGNSGTKVVEVRPKKELGNEYEKRYIIKYSEKNQDRKIDQERKCFGKWDMFMFILFYFYVSGRGRSKILLKW